MIVVDVGLNGDVVAGVRRPFRCVFMVSSRVLRESRRKSRRAREWKQKEGVSGGGEGGLDIIRTPFGIGGGGEGWAEERVAVEEEEAEVDVRAQNQDARLTGWTELSMDGER